MRRRVLVPLLLLLVLASLLAACGGRTVLPALFGGNSLDGVWQRTEMVVRRSAGPDQPVISPPFTVIGTLLIIDEEELTLIEQVGNSYRLQGAADNWTCALTGAYGIPISLTFDTDTRGEITWRAEDLAALYETMAEPWGNNCVYRAAEDGVPTALEDQVPVVAVPTLTLQFELLEGGTVLALSTRFEATQDEDGTLVLIERAYLYTRVK